MYLSVYINCKALREATKHQIIASLKVSSFGIYKCIARFQIQILEQEGTMGVRVFNSTPGSDFEKNRKQSPNACHLSKKYESLSSPEMRNITRIPF
jgi:hypothetical protein